MLCSDSCARACVCAHACVCWEFVYSNAVVRFELTTFSSSPILILESRELIFTVVHSRHVHLMSHFKYPLSPSLETDTRTHILTHAERLSFTFSHAYLTLWRISIHQLDAWCGAISSFFLPLSLCFAGLSSPTTAALPYHAPSPPG